MMRRLMLMIATALLTGPALAKDKYVYGAAPDWDRYKELGETALRAKLLDPDHYEIEWPNGYMQGGWRHKGKFPGYLTCGQMRALVPVKDRYPITNFVVVIDNDQVKTVDVSTRESNSLVNVMCEALVRHGNLPPARILEGPKDLPVPALGVSIRPMPEGAYIVETGPGSPAQHAGLTAGMVITRVNGIALADMGTAMTQVLGSAAPELTLETAAGEHIDIRRAP